MGSWMSYYRGPIYQYANNIRDMRRNVIEIRDGIHPTTGAERYALMDFDMIRDTLDKDLDKFYGSECCLKDISKLQMEQIKLLDRCSFCAISMASRLGAELRNRITAEQKAKIVSICAQYDEIHRSIRMEDERLHQQEAVQCGTN